MRKILTALTAAAALAAGTMTMTTKANAYAWWVIPAIVGAGVGGLAVGAAANENRVRDYDYGGPRGNVYVRPSGYDCRIIHERGPSGRMHRVRVCD